MVMLTSSLASAQTTGGGTTIFGQDETMIPNAVHYAVIFLFGIAFLFGAGSVVWGVMCYTRRQECTNWIIGVALPSINFAQILAQAQKYDFPSDGICVTTMKIG